MAENTIDPSSQKLTENAITERTKLFAKNTYKDAEGNKYGPTHTNALSDGDIKGKGNGEFLNDYNFENTGGSLDISARKENVKNNFFQVNKPYYVTDGGQ